MASRIENPQSPCMCCSDPPHKVKGKGRKKPLPNTLFQGVPTPRLSDGMADKLPIVPHIDFQSSQDHRSRGTPATYRSHIILIPSLGSS